MIESMRFTGVQRDAATEAVFQQHLDAVAADRSINACTAKTGNCVAFSFRNGQQSIITADRGNGIEVFDVTADERMEHPQQAKLFVWGDDVWAAIDTRAGRDNAIYLMKVSGEFGEPIELDYDNRNIIERNWAFFEYGGDLYAIHSVEPLRVLRMTQQVGGRATFEDHVVAAGDTLATLHVGSQAFVHHGSVYFVAHRALPLRNTNICCVMGALCRISLADWSISMSVEPMSHSLAEAIQGKPARVGVRSLTYYGSVIIDANGLVRLGYGFNDHDSAFSVHTLDSFNLMPIGDVITQGERDFANGISPVTPRTLRKLSPEQVEKATANASVCESCDHKRSIRLKVTTGLGEQDVYHVSCDKCTSCGGSMSLLSSCPEKKWN